MSVPRYKTNGKLTDHKILFLETGLKSKLTKRGRARVTKLLDRSTWTTPQSHIDWRYEICEHDIMKPGEPFNPYWKGNC
jgi:hypothetical protein